MFGGIGYVYDTENFGEEIDGEKKKLGFIFAYKVVGMRSMAR